MDQTEKIRQVIYFPSLTKSQTLNLPQDKNNIQFLPLHQLQEQGRQAHIGRFQCFDRFQSWFYFDLDAKILQQRPDKTDIAVIMYTSGSTGTPKGYFSKDHFIDLDPIDKSRVQISWI